MHTEEEKNCEKGNDCCSDCSDNSCEKTNK